MSRNRVKLNICGTDYIIISDEPEDYMIDIAKKVNDEMRDTLKTNDRISVTMAAVLTALKYCDDAHRNMAAADNLRSQIKDYIEEATNRKNQADELRCQKLKLEQEIQDLNSLIKEYDEIFEASSLNSGLSRYVDDKK